MPDQPYLLYGAYASYYTAKVRCYLRKKGIPSQNGYRAIQPFVKWCVPCQAITVFPKSLHPMAKSFRTGVNCRCAREGVSRRTRSSEHSLSTALCSSHGTPRQRGIDHARPEARWLFEENIPFITRDFGRTFQPQGDDQALMKYGQLIADRMTSYGLPAMTPDVQQALDTQYIALLDRLEAHFIDHPYLLGGHPSQADYSIMGALHAHMGHDPAGLRQLQLHGPRTLRWVEHMLTPEINLPNGSIETSPIQLMMRFQTPPWSFLRG